MYTGSLQSTPAANRISQTISTPMVPEFFLTSVIVLIFRPRASTLKNAGLAYLNLVKAPREDAEYQRDTIRIPHDPLGAASLLPWGLETDRSYPQQGVMDDCIGDAHSYWKRPITQATPRPSRKPKAKKAQDGWRDTAATRFMQLWKDFLEHEDAPLDSQYDIIHNIYNSLLDRLSTPNRRGVTKRNGLDV